MRKREFTSKQRRRLQRYLHLRWLEQESRREREHNRRVAAWAGLVLAWAALFALGCVR